MHNFPSQAFNVFGTWKVQCSAWLTKPYWGYDKVHEL